jgi:CHAD domain-containing protein
VKPSPVELDGARTPSDVLRRVTGVRLAEAGALASALQSTDPDGLHQFRISCKRLRYALERFAAFAPLFDTTASHFGHLQDALGEAHDCDLLLAQLPPTMPKTRARLLETRLGAALRASRLWNDALVLLGETIRFHDAQASA